MNFPFGNENYIFCRNSMEVELAKERFRKSFEGDFFGKLNFTTLEAFIKDESILYWVLVEDKIKVNTISRNASICILESIIKDKIDFDSYFKGVNSNSFFIATQIYSIMLKSVKNNIPVEAISARIAKFKRSIYPQNVFLDIASIIESYRLVMDRFNVNDTAMLIEKYLEKIYPSKIYMNNMKSKNFFIYKGDEENNFDDSFEELDNIETDSKVFDIVGINKKIEDCIKYKKNKKIDIYEREFENYFDMLFSLQESIEMIMNDIGYKKSNICIIVPKLNSIIENLVKELSLKLNINIRTLSQNNNIKNSSIAISSLFALAIKMDMQYVFNDDEKVEFVKLILQGIYNNKEKFTKASSDNLYDQFSDQMYDDFADQIYDDFSNQIYNDSYDQRYPELEIKNNLSDNISEINKQVIEEDIDSFVKIDKEKVRDEEYLEEMKSKEIFNLEEKDINYIAIRKKLNLYIREIGETEGILPDLHDDNYAAFIKKFYKRYSELNEESINQISQICALIDELSIFSKKSSERKFYLGNDNIIKFIKENVSNFTSTRRKIENKELGDILLADYREYINSSLDSDIYIILDARSVAFDTSIESEIDTSLAYMDDSILSNINSDNVNEFYRDYQEKIILDDIYKLIGNGSNENKKIYTLSSYTNIGGYDQENNFLRILHNLEDRSK